MGGIIIRISCIDGGIGPLTGDYYHSDRDIK